MEGGRNGNGSERAVLSSRYCFPAGSLFSSFVNRPPTGPAAANQLHRTEKQCGSQLLLHRCETPPPPLPHPCHVEAGMVIARAGASPGLKRIQGGGGAEIIATTVDTVDGWKCGVDECSVRVQEIFLFFPFCALSFSIPTISRKLLTRETIIPFSSKRGQRRKVSKG